MSDYLFETEHFRFTLSELHLLRSRFPYKKIEFRSISKIYIGKGIRVKRPLLTLAFGLILTIGSIFIFLKSTGIFEFIFNPKEHALDSGFAQAGKFLAGIIAMIGFMFVIGVISIYQATVKTRIMRIEFADGKHNVFDLDKLILENKYSDLKHFISTNFKGANIKMP